MKVGDRVEVGEDAEHDTGEVVDVVSGPDAGVDGIAIVRVRGDRAGETYVETSASLRIVQRALDRDEDGDHAYDQMIDDKITGDW